VKEKKRRSMLTYNYKTSKKLKFHIERLVARSEIILK